MGLDRISGQHRSRIRPLLRLEEFADLRIDEVCEPGNVRKRYLWLATHTDTT